MIPKLCRPARVFAAAAVPALSSCIDYEVRFPSKVLSANVREFDEENNTVTRKFSLAQLAREPALMRAEIFPPPRRLGTFLWLLVAIGGMAVIAAGALYLAYRRRTA